MGKGGQIINSIRVLSGAQVRWECVGVGVGVGVVCMCVCM